MKNSSLLRICIAGLFISGLAACGGGGGSSSTASTTATPATLSGKVIDGYISGAKVCLDVNSNNVCDAGEPTTTSGENGAWSLPPYAGSIAGLQVIAEVGATATDKDTGVIGAGNTYSLLAPAAASATVTPFSTMVSSTIAAGGGESRVSIGESLTNVSAQTGIPVAKLVANDYKENNDAKLAAVAQATTVAIAQVANILRSNADIKSNLTDGQIIQQAVVQVQQKVFKQLVSDGQLSGAASSSASDIKAAVTSAVTSVNLSGQIQSIIIATKSGDGNVLSMADLFKAGFVTPQFQSGDYINSAGARYDGPEWSPSDPTRRYWNGYRGLNVGYLQFDIDTATTPPPDIQFALANNNKWYVPYNDGEQWTFDGSAWVAETDIGGGSGSNATKPTFDQNCVIVAKNAKGTVTQRYCASEKKLDSKKMVDFIPSMCDSGSGVLSTCKTATFPAGSSAYDLTATTIANLSGSYNGLFELWVNTDGSWNGFCTKQWDQASQSCASNSGTVTDFIKWATFPNNQWTGDSCNTPFSFKSYDSTSRKGTMVWGSNPNQGCSGNFQFTSANVKETSNFEVITLAGKDVLIVPTPAIYRANNPSSNKPYFVFAAITSKLGVTGVWDGAFYPTNFKESIPFTGDPATNTQIINSVMFDAILKQKGIPPYPYKGKSSSGTWNGSSLPSTSPN
jgi:hypothetical protein